MPPILATLFVFAGGLNDRRRRLAKDDTGSVSVEQVLVTIGCVALSVAVITGITLYATGRIGDLND